MVSTGVFTKPRVSQRHEIVVAVDQVKLGGVFKGLRDVQVFGDFGIDGAILFISAVDHGMQPGAGDRVARGEKRDVPTPRHQALGDVAGHRLPGAVLPRRSTPGNRRQNRDPASSLITYDIAASTSRSATVANPVA